MAPLRSAGYVDPGWEHGVAQDEKKKKVKCNYCGKVVSGGIYRLKQHLARISGEVTYCDRAPEDVYLKMRENLEGCRSSKKQRLSEDDERTYLNFHSQEDDDEMDNDGYRRKGKKVLGDKSAMVNFTTLRSLGYVDPGWEHGVAQDERKKKVKCNYCGKIVSGGINRFKQHLARIPGEVAPCKNAPEDVFLKIKENMKWHRTGRRLRRPYVKETSEFYPHSENEAEEDEQEEDVMHHMSKEKVVPVDKILSKDLKRLYSGMSSGSNSEMFLKKSRFSSNSLKTPTYHAPPACKQPNNGFSKQNRKEVISAICEFFYHAGVPLHAVGSVYCQKMLELVGQYGPGLSSPSSRLVSGRLLQDEVASIKNYLVEYKASWAVTGCSIMADCWKDTQSRVLINFLVSCPRGVYFVNSTDVTDMVDDASSLFKLLDKVVDEVGEENVVQVVTQNTPCYKAVGKMLEDKRRNLFWTPCAAYCIDRILEDFMKIKLVEDCMEKGQKITKFIYNRTWLLNLMKKNFTGGQELLRPAITQYAASFATLQGLLEHRIGLKQLFQSNKWLSSQFSKLDEGKEVEKIVFSSSFWKKSQFIRKSVDPILQLLQKVDRDASLSLPSVYNDMYRAKLAIRSMYGDDARKYGPFWSVIDNHCSSLFHHPLCVAAYFLNPAYRYRSDYLTNPEVMRGLNECIVRMEPDSGRRISASMQISDFISAKADFGTDLAISTRTELDPAAWWQQHGINCLELQRIAVRILSQTCSSFGCEHNWSIYDQIHCQRQNRLAQKKLNDLVYAHYNLRLRERQLRRCNESVLLDNVLLEGLLDDWIVEAEKQSIQNDEEILYNEDGYDFEAAEFDDNNTDTTKGGSLEMVALADIEHLDVHCNGGAATDEGEDDLNFFDEDPSD